MSKPEHPVHPDHPVHPVHPVHPNHPAKPHVSIEPVTQTVTTQTVVINGNVSFDRSELLGYIEGLKFATPDAPMSIYNPAIETQLVAEGFASSSAVDENGVTVHKLVLTDEAKRAAFETEVRALKF